MKICFGMISYLPSQEDKRKLRIIRLNAVFKQLHQLGPNIPILIIAQNGNDYEIPEYIKDDCIIKTYEPLGILNARKTLRKEFLQTDFDYILMTDDDLVLEIEEETNGKYIKEIHKHPEGFCFLEYKHSQLNLCAISRYIYEKEDICNIDPTLNEGGEDLIYSNYLHFKYPDNEFTFEGIKAIHGIDPTYNLLPSTGGTKDYGGKAVYQPVFMTSYMIAKFEQGHFDIEKLKSEAREAGKKYKLTHPKVK